MGSLNRLYPHLLPQDILVWLRFLDKYSDTYHDFEYDIRQMVHDLSMRRIDVIAHSPRLITIIEVTRQAGLKAVGQMITYPILYRQTFGPTKPLRSLLICEELNPDIEPALRLHHIGWQLFPPPENA